jgi:hypothetical protein
MYLSQFKQLKESESFGGSTGRGVLFSGMVRRKQRTLLLSAMLVLLVAAALMLVPGKAYAATGSPLPVGSSTGTVWCQSDEDGEFSFYFYLSERSNVRITINHEVYSSGDFAWVNLANKSAKKNDFWDYDYIIPSEKKNTSDDTVLDRRSFYIPSYMPSSTITYSNLSAGGPYYFNVATDSYSYAEGYGLNSYFSVSITDIVPLTSAKIAVGKTKSYTGKAIKLRPTVSLYNKVLTLNKDYKIVSYKNNKNPGKASVTIKGIGKYSGSKTATFRIAPKKVALATPVAGNNKVTVKWGKAVGASGYQVRYRDTYQSYDYSKGKYVTKWDTWSSPKSAPAKAKSKVLKLADKQKYQVQVRAYKTIDGKRYYGAWSSAKSVKTK